MAHACSRLQERCVPRERIQRGRCSVRVPERPVLVVTEMDLKEQSVELKQPVKYIFLHEDVNSEETVNGDVRMSCFLL